MGVLKFKNAPDVELKTQGGFISVVNNSTPAAKTVEGEQAKKAKLGSIITCNFAMCIEINSSKNVEKSGEVLKIIKFYAGLKELAVKNDIDFDKINQKLIIKHSVILSNTIQDAQMNVLNQVVSIAWGSNLKIDEIRFCELIRDINLDENGVEAQSLSLLPDTVKDVYANIIQERRVRYGSI